MKITGVHPGPAGGRYCRAFGHIFVGGWVGETRFFRVGKNTGLAGGRVA